MIDLFLVYQFIRRLSTPFTEWDAYKHGVIDANGKILKKKSDRKTSAEKKALTTYDTMILNLKKMLETIPGGQSKLASYTAALYLIKEHQFFRSDSILNESIDSIDWNKQRDMFINVNTYYNITEENVNPQNEEAPTNNVGSGAVAGLGKGDQGEPGLTKKQQVKYKRKKRYKDMILYK